MQQRSFQKFRLENERKGKKPNKQTACLITKQGLRCHKKEKMHHGTIKKKFSSVIIIVIILLFIYFFIH